MQSDVVVHPGLASRLRLGRLQSSYRATCWALVALRPFYGLAAVGALLAVLVFESVGASPRILPTPVPERVARALPDPVYDEEIVYLVASETVTVPRTEPSSSARVSILVVDTAEVEARVRNLIDLITAQLESQQIALSVVDLRPSS